MLRRADMVASSQSVRFKMIFFVGVLLAACACAFQTPSAAAARRKSTRYLCCLFSIATPKYRRLAKLDPEVDAKTKKYGLEVC